MFLRRFSPVVLVVQLSYALVLVQSINIRDGDNLEELNNHLGQTPCTLDDEIATSCQSSQSQRALGVRDSPITPPVPSECTCNNVFFNLWSACLLIHGNAALPVFHDWGLQCRNSSLNLTAGNPDKNNVNIPSWAFANVSDGSTFNVDAALSVAQKKGWTTLQKVVPVIVGVGLLLLASFGAFLYGRKSRRQTFSSAITHCLRFRPRVYKVRKASRNGHWSIEPTGAEEYFPVDAGKRTPSHRSSKGHTRLSSSSTVADSVLADPVQPDLPLLSRMASQLRSLPDQFQLPWKDRPVEVQNKPPRRGFRVDSWDVSTSSGPSTVSGSRSGSAPTVTSGAGRSQPHETILEEDEESLVSDIDVRENSVLFISRQPGTSTMGGSGSEPRSVQVVPPTPTELSLPSAVHPTEQLAHLPVTTQIPPPPTKPAPAPPSSLRHDLPQRVSSPSNTLPITRPQSPLVRYGSPDNVMRGLVHTQPLMASANISRQFPMTVEIERNSLSRTGGFSPRPSIESFYLDRHPSLDHQPDVRKLRGPRVELPVSSPLFSGVSSEQEQTRRDQIPSRSSSTLHHTRSSSPFDRSLTPTVLSPRRRGTDEFYSLENLYPPDSSQTHSTESITPGRGDHVMLFPGSVRAAGYAPQSPPAAWYHDSGI